MKGITDWEEAKAELVNGDIVRLHLGPARVIEGKWWHSSIQVLEVSQALSGDVKEHDGIVLNKHGGFKRLRYKYRDRVLLTREWFLLKLDYDTDSVGEDE